MCKIVVLENSFCNFKQCLSAHFVSFGLWFMYSYVFNFRNFYIPLLMVALDEILVIILVSCFALLEAPVGMNVVPRP